MENVPGWTANPGSLFRPAVLLPRPPAHAAPLLRPASLRRHAVHAAPPRRRCSLLHPAAHAAPLPRPAPLPQSASHGPCTPLPCPAPLPLAHAPLPLPAPLRGTPNMKQAHPPHRCGRYAAPGLPPLSLQRSGLAAEIRLKRACRTSRGHTSRSLVRPEWGPVALREAKDSEREEGSVVERVAVARGKGRGAVCAAHWPCAACGRRARSTLSLPPSPPTLSRRGGST
eukprot:scaffold30142_cov30-Tisochrysis_lutea.AAC.2